MDMCCSKPSVGVLVQQGTSAREPCDGVARSWGLSMSLATQQFSMSRCCSKPVICYYDVRLLYVSNFKGQWIFFWKINRSGQVVKLDLVEHDPKSRTFWQKLTWAAAQLLSLPVVLLWDPSDSTADRSLLDKDLKGSKRIPRALTTQDYNSSALKKRKILGPCIF